MLITIGGNNQKYTDTQHTNHDAEDSSYDSEDCDNDKSQYLLLSTKDRNNQRLQQNSSNDGNIDHEQVSRTTSDTLGQEFAEYVTNASGSCCTLSNQQLQSDTAKSMAAAVAYSTAYKARVEFALKLGYTERLVQTALARLGSDPTQNELLAELITLGAQYSNKSDFACESPTAECLSPKNSSSKTSSSISGIGLSGISTGSSSNNDSHNMLMQMQNSNNSTSDDLNQLNCLRPIVVDGSNVAMSHGNKEIFSCRGIKLAVDWFKNRGHKDITVFVPKWRKESSRPDNPIKDQEILNELERERMLVFTPSRLVGGKRMVCYDDRYILKLAVDNDGIVVSNDNYRDLVQESSEFKKVVEERVLMFSFVNDRFMPPDDPLGRSGPTLDNFLRTQPKKSDPPPPCPYGKKCTYGNKCKFHHPERGIGPHKSVTERLSEHAARHLLARNSSSESTRTPVQGKSLSVPLCGSGETINNCYSAVSNTNERPGRKALCRSRSGVPDSLNQQQQQQHLTKSQQHQQQQQQQQKQHQHQQSSMSTHPIWGTSVYRPMDKNSDPTNVGFLKSHSIENISREIFPHSMNTPPPNYPSMWSPQNVGSSSVSSSIGNIPPLSRAQNQPADKNDESVNLHRKLQRQLTLNPAGCDPRIYQMQRCVTPSNVDGSSAGGQSSHSPHRPLAPSLSGPRNYRPTQWDLHQSVTRIASAPDPSRPPHNGPPPASSSEPHINLWPHHKSSSAQDQRRRLHYHLASIFPEEQVQTVMQMYPDETNPQTICAAILSMFS